MRRAAPFEFDLAPVIHAPRNPALDAVRKNLSVELDERRRALARTGKRLFDFGLGDPKEPTPAFLREALRAAVPEVSQYPSAFGTAALRRAAAGYLARRFAVTVDPEAQVLACAGAKEAIFHLPLAFAGADPRRRKVVYPDPGYPTYEVGARFAGLEPVPVPLRAGTASCSSRTRSGRTSSPDPHLLDQLSAQSDRRDGAARLPGARRGARPGGTASSRSDECYADVYFGDPPHSLLEVAGENCSRCTPARSGAA